MGFCFWVFTVYLLFQPFTKWENIKLFHSVLGSSLPYCLATSLVCFNGRERMKR